MNTSYNMGQMNKYSFINTGVLITEKNAGLGVLSLNFFGISMNQKGWGLAASTSILEDYDRPKIESVYFIGDTLYQTIFFKQEGLLRNFNLALSRKVNSWISAGIGINFVMGSFRKEWSEKWIFSEITISDEKIHDFSGFYLNGGMVFNLTHKLSLGVIFRTPFTKNATSESLLENNSPGGDTFIQIQVKDKSHYKQPLVLGAGLNYQLFNNFRIALDMSYFNWASYTVNYFGESLDRNFKNIIKLNTGIEYQGFIRIFGHKMTVPMRVGFVYDPQPMRNPNSKYSYFSLGSGIRGKNIHLDVASMIGFETGSGDKLRGLKWTMTLGFHL